MKYDAQYGARKKQEREARNAECARKARVLRMQVVGVVICILAFAAMGFTVLPHHHSSTPLTTISVVPGDTLWSIALDHPVDSLTTGETVNLIREVNDITTSTLQAGDEIQVPAAPVQEVASASTGL